MTTRKKISSAITAKCSLSESDGLLDVKSLEIKSIEQLENALLALRELSSARIDAKMSAARPLGVIRELRELIKVMSVYGC